MALHEASTMPSPVAVAVASVPCTRIVTVAVGVLALPPRASRLTSTGPVGGMVAPVDRGRHVASLAGALGLPLSRAT